MLKTNTRVKPGVCEVRPWVGSAYYELATGETRELIVFPNPCVNPSDHKKPAAYSFTVNQRKEPYGTAFDWDNWGSGYLMSKSGCLSGYFGSNPIIVMDDNSTSIQNKALEKLYDKVRNSEISLNTTIGEGRETLDMVMAVAKSAHRFSTDFKRAKARASRKMIDALKNPLQTVGGFELLWSVGLSPLINDVENLRNHVANKQELNVPIHVDSRSGKTQTKKQVYTSGGATVTEERTLSQRIEYGLDFMITDLHTFENWRLGLTVRPTLVWELTTLSFVVDYFITIGQYLSLLEASLLNNGISFVGGYVTTSSKDSWVINSVKPWWKNPNARSYGHSWTASGSVSKKDRQVLTSFPTPLRPTVKLPHADSQLLNCAALLSQLLSRR